MRADVARAWGATVGPQTAALVEQILANRPHPDQGYRSCLGFAAVPYEVIAEPANGLVDVRAYVNVSSTHQSPLMR